MQVIANGLISGMAIALMATAFQVVYLPTRVFFVGLAGIYSATPYIAYAVLLHGGGWMPAVAAAVTFSIVVAFFCEWANHARLVRHQASSAAHLVTSLGIYIVIIQVIGLIWGNDAKALRTGMSAVTHWGGIIVTGPQWITLGVSALLVFVFSLFLKRSGLGLRLRAMADNPTEFALRGYNVDLYRLLAFAIAGFLAAGSSLVVSYDVGFDPHVGLDALLLAIVAVIMGGRDSFYGSGLAGLLLGIIRAEVIWFLGSRWQDPITFGLLLLFLFLRPQGLLGQKRRLEVQI
jgi:branched-chain amino acid transport system permease protein